jgi:hypothetical protein
MPQQRKYGSTMLQMQSSLGGHAILSVPRQGPNPHLLLQVSNLCVHDVHLLAERQHQLLAGLVLPLQAELVHIETCAHALMEPLDLLVAAAHLGLHARDCYAESADAGVLASSMDMACVGTTTAALFACVGMTTAVLFACVGMTTAVLFACVGMTTAVLFECL